MGPAIFARALSKSWRSWPKKEHRALDAVTLEVPRGSVFGLVGPNGAGKTTFIKLLLGIARPTSGSVEVLGGAPDDVAIRQQIGYLPERLHLPRASTAMAFLASVSRLKGLRPARANLASLLSRVGLGHAAEQKLGSFSKGMKQRVGLAAALIGSPQLLVLDEPTDGIDPLGRVEVRNILLEEKRRGATVLLNSHLLAETEKVCDRVGIIHLGKLRREGPLDELTRQRTGWSLRFASTGAVSLPEFSALGDGRFSFDGDDVAALNLAIDRARAAGAQLLELTPASKDLEELLHEVTR